MMNHEPIFTAEPIIGWRWWLAGEHPDTKETCYRSPYYRSDQWKIGETTEALNNNASRYNYFSDKEEVVPNGVIGFYAFKNPEYLFLKEDALCYMAKITIKIDYTAVAGPVLFSGKVIEHEYGYRAQKACMPVKPLGLTHLIKSRGNTEMLGERLYEYLAEAIAEHFAEWII